MTSIQVTELNIYPVKSCRGISVDQAAMESRGFQYDRRWMIIDTSGRFVSQRTYPRLALIAVRLGARDITLAVPGIEDLIIPLRLAGKRIVQVDIWKDTVGALAAEESANDWVSTVLEVPCRLVYMSDESFRPVDPEYAVHKDQVSFADAYPFHLTTEASLADLNTRLSSPISMNRFRPNIVLSGCGAYEEDTWKRIRIGSALFHVVKPCARCATTVVNQETGIRGEEPLHTLSRYRNDDGKILFGQNLIHGSLSTVHVGDPVTVLE